MVLPERYLKCSNFTGRKKGKNENKMEGKGKGGEKGEQGMGWYIGKEEESV